MFRQIQIIALNQEGEQAINKLIEDDEKESPQNKAKVQEQLDLSLLSKSPLIYSATVKDALIKNLEKTAKRIGQFGNLKAETLVDNFMLEMKNTAISRMGRNGAVFRKDYVVKLLEDYELDDSKNTSSSGVTVIDNKVVHTQ